MSSDPPTTFGADFKRFFVRGLAVLLPSVLTLWILVKAYQFIDRTIAQPINAGVRFALGELATRWPPLERVILSDSAAIEEESIRRLVSGEPGATPEVVRHDLVTDGIDLWWSEWAMVLDWIGILVAIVAVYFAGRLVGGFVGRRIHRSLERLIVAVPLFSQLYPSIKRVVDFLFGDDKPLKFNRVVVVQYPRKGIWSIGLVTGDTMRSIQKEAGESITVFIPSSPTPFTGYTITVPRSEAHELPISIDEALLFTISGGVLVPDHETLVKNGIAESGEARILNPPTPTPTTTPKASDEATDQES